MRISHFNRRTVRWQFYGSVLGNYYVSLNGTEIAMQSVNIDLDTTIVTRLTHVKA